MQQLMRKLDITLADLYVLGLIVCIGSAEVAHLAGLFLGLGMGSVSIIWGGLFAVLLLFCVIVCWKWGGKQKGVVSCHPALPISFLCLVLVQLLYIFCVQMPVTPGDIMVETVATFLHENGIHKVNPLTGGEYVNPLSMRYKLICLPTLYSVGCRLTGLLPQVFVCHIVPLFVLGGCYLAYYKLSEQLFGEHMGKRYTFMILVALSLVGLQGAAYLDGYGLLQGGYMGTSIRGLILIPYTLQAGLGKQWWKCVLCVLAEACVCFTLWGLGFCLLSTAILVILHLCEENKKGKGACA